MKFNKFIDYKMSDVDTTILKALVEHIGMDPNIVLNQVGGNSDPITDVEWTSKEEAEYYDHYLTISDESLNGNDRVLLIQVMNEYEAYYNESKSVNTLIYKKYNADKTITFNKNTDSGLWETKDINEENLKLKPDNDITGALKKSIDIIKYTGEYRFSLTSIDSAKKSIFFIIDATGSLRIFIFDHEEITTLMSIEYRHMFYTDFLGSDFKLKYTIKDYDLKFLTFEVLDNFNEKIYYQNPDNKTTGIFELCTTPTWNFIDRAVNETTYLIAKINTPIVPGTIFKYTKEDKEFEYVCTNVSAEEMTFVDSSSVPIKFEYNASECTWRVLVGENVIIPDNISSGFFNTRSLLWAFIKALYSLV